MATKTILNAAEALDRISDEKEFRSLNMRAEWVEQGSSYREYRIFSYKALIATVAYSYVTQPDGDITYERDVWITTMWHSKTTTKHTNYVRKALTPSTNQIKI